MMRLNLLVMTFDPCEGYGRYALHLLRALHRNGVQVHPILLEQVAMPGEIQRMAGLDWSRLTLSLMPGDYLAPIPGRQWAYTMWEDTKPPPKWIQVINDSFERLIVPCPHNHAAFRDSGVETPVHVVNGGIEPGEFPKLQQQTGNFTFMVFGDRGHRKGWATAWDAFVRAFPASKYPDVRLLIKLRKGGSTARRGDSRIQTWIDDVSNPADIYAQADCLLFPSHCEGWGMPPREAAAMAIPVIATRHGGLEVGIDDWAIPLNRFEMVRSELAHGGEWAMPDVDELVEQMRWVYEHPAEAKAKAQRARDWLHTHQSWDDSARQMIRLLERYGE